MQDMYAAVNKMQDPSLIRAESDEVTYPMHILLRYEIEKGLLLGDIAVDDVPAVWNEKMQEYLGCTPEDDAQVCGRCVCMHGDHSRHA
jgi:carboxypeptidase Taq